MLAKPPTVTGIHTGTQTTEWVYIGSQTEVDVAMVWTGDPTTAVTLQGTNAYRTTDGKGATIADADLDIFDLSTAFSSVPAGSASQSETNFIDVGPMHVRLQFVGSNGASGDVTSTFKVKD